jgi:hypothetical protein
MLRDKESQTFVCLRKVTKSVTTTQQDEPLFSDILVNSKIGFIENFKMPKIISSYYIYAKK